MEKKANHSYRLVAFGVILYAALMNLGAVIGFVKNIGDLALPAILGFILAFIMNVPMRGYENLLLRATKNAKRPPKPKLINGISLFLAIISVLLVVALVCIMLIPELIESAVSLYELVVESWPDWVAFFREHNIDITWITEWFEKLNISQLIEQVLSGAGSLISSAVGVVSSTVSIVGNTAIAVIIAIYTLLSKQELCRQGKKLIQAHCSDKIGAFLFHFGQLLNTTFTKFLTGQCLEACILGSLIFIVFSILGIPYAALIGVLTAVLAFLPYVGAFFACVLGMFLVLLAAPSKVLICLIAYLVVQFVENQLIYPHVVGTSVGLSPLWTLIAVLVGGKLLGLFGMIFFIPLTAVLVTLLKEYTGFKLTKKQPPTIPPSSERTDDLIDQ